MVAAQRWRFHAKWCAVIVFLMKLFCVRCRFFYPFPAIGAFCRARSTYCDLCIHQITGRNQFNEKSKCNESRPFCCDCVECRGYEDVRSDLIAICNWSFKCRAHIASFERHSKAELKRFFSKVPFSLKAVFESRFIYIEKWISKISFMGIEAH